METGPLGLNGQLAARRVGQGHRQENARVRTPDPSMVEDRAKDLRNRLECAMLGIAPVSFKLQHPRKELNPAN